LVWGWICRFRHPSDLPPHQ